MSNREWQITSLTAADYCAARLPSQPLLQSAFWGAVKSTVGWQSHYLALSERSGEGTIPLLVLLKRFPFGNALAYIAHAPLFTAVADDRCYTARLASLSAGLVTHLRLAAPAGARVASPFLVRWDIARAGDPPSAILPSRRSAPAQLLPAPHSIQPRHTIVVDLQPPPNEILAGMKAKTRYNIRLSERKGVQVRPAIARDSAAVTAELRRWYALYEETCVRNRMVRRPFSYFQALFRLSRRHTSDVQVELLVAEYEHTVLGGIIVAYYNGVATYLFGASANRLRNLMANYLLQWQAIVRSRELDCRHYDLYGVAPTAHGHYLSGLYRFKTGFGGALVTRWGSFDYAVAPARAHLYRTVERARLFYHRRIKTHQR